MNENCIDEETKLILLLCGRFGQQEQNHFSPLSNSEFRDLRKWMDNKKLSLANLADKGYYQALSSFHHKTINADRIIYLLDRGMTLGFALEHWLNKGMWVLGSGSDEYPEKLKNKFGLMTPPLIYGFGNKDLLYSGGFAVVGSRNADEESLDFARKFGNFCAEQGLQVITGGARGVDTETMFACLKGDGRIVCILASALFKTAVSKKFREPLKSGKMALISFSDPEAGFSIGNAMGRNKYIYALSDYSLVVHSTPEKGGTWAGAIENIKKKFSLPFIWVEKGVAEGNLELTRKGAIPLTKDCLYPQAKFRQWLKEQREIWDNDLKSTQEPQKSIKVNEKNCFKKSEQLELFPDFPVH